MIQKFSILKAVDNSGVILTKCIHVYGGYRQRYGRIGTKVLVTILSMKSAENQRKSKLREKLNLTKGSLVKGVIIRTKTNKKQIKSLNKIFFQENSIVLLSEKDKFLSTRVFGGVMSGLRKTKLLRITSMAGGIIRY